MSDYQGIYCSYQLHQDVSVDTAKMTKNQQVRPTELKPKGKLCVKYIRAAAASEDNPTLISLDTNGVLTIHQGYHWDGVTGFKDQSNLGGNRMFASLVHDALYNLMRDNDYIGEIDRKEFQKRADNIFYELCIIDGTSKVITDFLAWFLERFGEGNSEYVPPSDGLMFSIDHDVEGIEIKTPNHPS